jgi:hypothetical protein
LTELALKMLASSLCRALLLLALILGSSEAALRPAPGAAWTLILQLPGTGALQVQRGAQRLSGEAATVVRRLSGGQSGMQRVRRIRAGTVSIDSSRVRDLQVAGRMLIVTVAPTRRVHVVSTNQVPGSENPARRALVGLQLLAGNELHARAPFAVVDERGRTAVLFQ